ncbi:unnamed protein product [Knipowitschia caucasica]
MDAFARLQLMRRFIEQHPSMESIMDYGRMAQMTQDEVLKYLDIFGNEQWKALKKKHGINTSFGLSDSSDSSDWDDSDSETRSRSLLQENTSENKPTDGGTSQKSDTSHEEEGLDSRSSFVSEAAEVTQREMEPKQKNKRKKKFPIKKEAKMPDATKVSKKHLSESLKLKIIDAHKAGEGCKKISKRLQVPVSTAKYIVKKWKLTGTVEVKARSGRPRKITDTTVHNMVSKVSENPYVTLRSIQAGLAEAGVEVHCSTITRLLNKHGLQVKQKKSSAAASQTLTSIISNEPSGNDPGLSASDRPA